MNQIGIAAFTLRGKQLAARIAEGLSGQYETVMYESGLKDWCRGLFEVHSTGIIFVGACGIAVRTIAPYLQSKTTDPAVLVIDEAGQYVISLLSGHIGGANQLALQTAGMIGAVPVITTATDVNGKFAVDVFARQNHLRIGSMKAAKEISAAILRGETVGVYCTGKIEGKVPPELTVLSEADTGSVPVRHLICICEQSVQPSFKRAKGDLTETFDRFDTILYLYPSPYILGLGCRKGKYEDEIRQTAEEMLLFAGISWQEISGMASIDLKKEEEGLLMLSCHQKLPFETYSADRLKEVPGEFSSSGFVRQTTGVDNVCERAALCMAGPQGKLIYRKYARNGVTAALAVQDWSVHFDE